LSTSCIDSSPWPSSSHSSTSSKMNYHKRHGFSPCGKCGWVLQNTNKTIQTWEIDYQDSENGWKVDLYEVSHLQIQGTQFQWTVPVW
jgi:hypothetical protein